MWGFKKLSYYWYLCFILSVMWQCEALRNDLITDIYALFLVLSGNVKL